MKKYLQVIAGCLAIAAGAAALYSLGGTPFDWRWWVVVLGFQIGIVLMVARK
mgnify:CR=1